MKVMKYIFAIGIIMASLYACTNDDDNIGATAVPVRDRAEQQLNEEPKIREYLKTHSYTLVDNPANPDYQIPVFDTIVAVAGNVSTSIWESGIDSLTITREDVDYKIYMIKLNEGDPAIEAKAPTFADSTFVTYRGELFYDNEDQDGDGIPDEADFDADGDGEADLIDEIARIDSDGDGIADDSDVDTNPNADDDDNDGIINDKDPVDNDDISRRVFDSSVTPQWFQQLSVIVGWREVLTTIKGAPDSQVDTDGNGTIDYTGFGNVIMFIPSGLAYYNVFPPGGGIPLYSPLIFNVQLYDVEESDHDGDGIPSYLEDIDGDRNLVLDGGDNTDGDGAPNYLDADDDGDGTLTRDELTVSITGEIIYYDDDEDGIYNHLDSDDKEIKN